MAELHETFYTIQPTARMMRLRKYYIENTKLSDPTYVIDYDLAMTRSMKETEGEPMVIRRAKAFAACVQAMPADIFPDEPFVGWFLGSPTAVAVSAEMLGARLEIEIDHYKCMDEEDRRIVKEEIIPYWKGSGDFKRHWFYRNYEMLPPETRNLLYGDPDPDLSKIGIITRSRPSSHPRVNVKEVPGETTGLGRGIINDGIAPFIPQVGTGHPMFLNNDVFVENFLARGTLGGPPVPIELARTSGAIGCNEPHVANYDSEFTMGSFLLLPHMLEMALADGYSRNHDKYMGVRTGDPRSFETFEDLQAAYLKQMAYFVGHSAITIKNSEMALAAGYPTVYTSALIEDCIEKGMTREDGGARFNFGPCIATAGATDVGDSLAAIKKLVYDEKKITMEVLLHALEKNFEGYDALRKELLQVPKFGNDNDDTDEMVAWVMKTYCNEIIRHKNSRGGHLIPYQNPLGYYVANGRLVGALPSGRKAGTPLSDGISPTLGVDVNGPTAVLNSVGKIDNTSVFFGQTLNIRLNKETFANDTGIRHLAALIRTFVDLKIHHCQFNLVSSETLRSAQQEPDAHQELTVRVAGYVAYFTRLSKSVQDSLIARNEHGI